MGGQLRKWPRDEEPFTDSWQKGPFCKDHLVFQHNTSLLPGINLALSSTRLGSVQVTISLDNMNRE